MSLFGRWWSRWRSAASVRTESVSAPAATSDATPEQAAPCPPTTPESAGREPETVEEALRWVDGWRERGEVLQALSIGRRAQTRFRDPVLGLRLARLHAERGDASDAIELIEALSPALRSDEAELLLGELLELRGRPLDARAAYERVLARDVGHPAARQRLSKLSPTRELPQGATIATSGAELGSRYRVERELGRGGAGTVFEAFDTRCERRVALKVYHGRTGDDRARFATEIRVPSALEHPGVVRILDADPELLSIALERLPRGSVRDAVRRGELTVAGFERALDTALEALAVVHSAGWLHRDLKPSNLLVRDDGRVVLTDFGLALPIRADGLCEGRSEGTPAYAAPEQLRGDTSGPGADVHALSASFLELAREGRLEPSPTVLEALRGGLASRPEERPTVERLRSLVSGSAPCP